MRRQLRVSSLLLSAAIPFATADPIFGNDSFCGCYLTNGEEGHYFSYHRFFDFRNLPQYAGVPDVIQDARASAEADPTSSFFSSRSWDDFWMINNWNNSWPNASRSDVSYLMVNSPNNVYIEANSDPESEPATWLTLRTQRLRNFQTAAEIETLSPNYKYVSVRMLARTRGGPGAVTALFTYRVAPTLSEVQESDLEVLTGDPLGLVRYTNQPSYTEDGDSVPNATKNVTLPRGLKWTDWAVHRLDWTPGMTTWYVDDVLVFQSTFQVPEDESAIILNAWSDGGEWSGNMTVGDAAWLQVQWIEVVYNNTDHGKKTIGVKGKSCRRVCSVDETPQLGTPVLLWESAAGGLRTQGMHLPWALPIVVGFTMVLISGGLL
ncbi:hydrolase-like protein [Thermochaetoides thermophila DSM 1495]|jgi:Beta-glucanase/Beta-glucan synthetase|uniref:Hydrolase-like protein n=1 Tax=Chaetomium thermophilum (strain DSM 1495 / CBS 144.50 / IMI 039719) TaxID=759272 RepID=G0S5R2_CHATD|nr:hydrolase-like protein [Thermochaetoides thermophila DSM 1495]EGS20681.1 hydrolase-like protein [Thermochaetoides thermophila DSM 1495]